MSTAIEIIEPTEPTEPAKDYNSPEHYRCGECGVTGVRLWREYNTFLNYQHLYCRVCAVKDQKKTPTDLERYDRDRCDQIGWLVPAVPTRDGETFWGYSSVPQGLCNWWFSLPTMEDETLPVHRTTLKAVLHGYHFENVEDSGPDGVLIELGHRSGARKPGSVPSSFVQIRLSAPEKAVKKAEVLLALVERDTTPDGEKQAARCTLARLGREAEITVQTGDETWHVNNLRDFGALMASIADDYNERVTTAALRHALASRMRVATSKYVGIRAYTNPDLGYRFERRGVVICEGSGPIYTMVDYDMQAGACKRAIDHLDAVLEK
jgi:hypothetical protein